MKTYLVSDVAIMFNVNEETVRRWIRDGKLGAKRGVGRSGHSITMDDIVSFANKPPRAYLLSLETWLKSNGINYEKIEDATDKKTKNLAAGIAGATGAAAAATGIATTGAAATGAATAGMAAATIAGAATIAPLLAVPAVALGAAKLMKRKNYQTYSILISDSDNDISDEGKTYEQSDAKSAEGLTDEESFEACEADSEAPTSIEADVTQGDTNTATNVLDEISRAKQLLDAEIITQEEFATIKAKLIAKL